MRAPPESLIPINGIPFFSANSAIFTIFSAKTSPRLPPITVKSWEKSAIERPSTVAKPTTTPSP